MTVIDELGNELFAIGETFGLCRFLQEASGDYSPCHQTRIYASRQSDQLGEGYIFSCPAGLINFSVPILENGIFKGAVIAGPLIMDFPDEIMADEIIKKFNLTLGSRGKLNTYLKTLQIIEPSRVTHLSKLLFTAVTSVMHNDKNALQERHLKHTQQVEISQSIHDLKYEDENNMKENPSKVSRSFYPYETEKELLLRVKNGDIIGAKSILNDLIGHILFSSAGDIAVIKSQTLELCTLLSRAVVESGGDPNQIFGLNRDFIIEMNDLNNIEDLSFWLIKVLDKFTENIFYISESKNASIIQKAISFINENYMRHISLDSVADHVHLNPSYFSTLFKKELDLNFSSYLNKTRIEQAKLLLKNSDLSILEIALSTGFEEQSYFTKVFKAVTKLTPKEYKQKSR